MYDLCSWICRDCNKWWYIECFRMYVMLSRLLCSSRSYFMHVMLSRILFCRRRAFMHTLSNWNLHDRLLDWKNICLIMYDLCSWICRDCNKWWHIERFRMYVMLSRLLCSSRSFLMYVMLSRILFCNRRTFMYTLSNWHLHDWLLDR